MANLYDYVDTVSYWCEQYGVDYNLAMALMLHESGGSNEAISSAGAIGFGQLMPETAGELGVDPYDPNDNIRGSVAYLRKCLDLAGGNTDVALANYNTGAGAVSEHMEKYGTPFVYDETAQHNQGIRQNYLELTGSMEGWSSDGFTYGMTNDFWTNIGNIRDNFEPQLQDNEPDVAPITDSASFWDMTADSFKNAWYNNGTIALARLKLFRMGNKASMERSGWQPSQQDIDDVIKALPTSEDAQSFVVLNARSSEELQQLIAMKKEDLERARRVDARPYGLHSMGGLAGFLLDPLNFIPLGFGASATLKGANIGRKALLMGADGLVGNVIDQSLATRYGGYENNLAQAGMLGFVGGAGLMMLGSLIKRGVVKKTGKVAELSHVLERQIERSKVSPLAFKQTARKLETSVDGTTNSFLNAVVRKELRKGERLSDNISAQVNQLANRPNVKIDTTEAMLGVDKENFTFNPVTGDVHIKSGNLNVDTVDRLVNKGEIFDLVDNFNTKEILAKNADLLARVNPDSKIFNQFANHVRESLNRPQTSNRMIQDMLDTAIISKDYKRLLSSVSEDMQTDNSPMKLLLDLNMQLNGETDTTKGMWNTFKKALLRSKWLGNTYGRLYYSDNKYCREATKLLIDPTQASTNGVTVEDLMNQYVREFNETQARLQESFGRYFNKQMLGLKGLTDTTPIRTIRNQFGSEVQKVLENPTYAKSGKVDPNVLEAAIAYKDLRKRHIDLLSKTGLIDKDRIFNYDGAHRSVDITKRGTLLRAFNSADEAVDFLYKYAKRAMTKEHIDIVRRYYMRENNITNELEVDEQAFSKFLDSKQREWALGTIDQGESLQTKATTTGVLPSFLRFKLPMDTSTPARLNGMEWSYDVNLRNNDVLSITDLVNKRTASSLAFARSGIDDPSTYLKDLRDKAQQEATRLRQRYNNQSQVRYIDEDLKQLDYALRQIGGAYFNGINNVDRMSLADRIGAILNNFSYATSGLNMGINAITEHFSLIGNTGLYRVVSSLCPPLDSFVQGLRKAPPVSHEQLKVFVNAKMNLDLLDSMTYDPSLHGINSSGGLGAIAEQAVRTAEEMSFALSKITQKVSAIGRVTRTSIYTSYTSTLTELASWADGSYKSFLRHNMFSERRLQSCGITDINNFKDFVKSIYKDLDPSDPLALTNRLEQLSDSDPMNYARLIKMLDSESRRAILQPSIGATNMAWRGNPFTRAMLQFKDFSRLSIAGHIVRSLEYREREDFMRWLASGISGTAALALREYTKAYMYYPKDEQKRTEFLNRSLSIENLGKAMLTRSSILAALGLAEDMGVTMFGGETGRTTAQHSQTKGLTQSKGDIGNIVTSLVNQAPVAGMLKNWTTGFSGAISDMTEYGELSDESYRDLTNIVPVHRFLPISALLANCHDINYASRDELGERKRRKELEVTSKRKMNKKGNLLDLLNIK